MIKYLSLADVLNINPEPVSEEMITCHVAPPDDPTLTAKVTPTATESIKATPSSTESIKVTPLATKKTQSIPLSGTGNTSLNSGYSSHVKNDNSDRSAYLSPARDLFGYSCPSDRTYRSSVSASRDAYDRNSHTRDSAYDTYRTRNGYDTPYSYSSPSYDSGAISLYALAGGYTTPTHGAGYSTPTYYSTYDRSRTISPTRASHHVSSRSREVKRSGFDLGYSSPALRSLYDVGICTILHSLYWWLLICCSCLKLISLFVVCLLLFMIYVAYCLTQLALYTSMIGCYRNIDVTYFVLCD